MPIPVSRKWLNLHGQERLLPCCAARMRAMPLLGAAGPLVTAGLEVLIHFGRAIRQGRKVDLSLKKMDDRD
jgi:hypothetical protein